MLERLKAYRKRTHAEGTRGSLACEGRSVICEEEQRVGRLRRLDNPNVLSFIQRQVQQVVEGKGSILFSETILFDTRKINYSGLSVEVREQFDTTIGLLREHEYDKRFKGRIRFPGLTKSANFQSARV